MRMPPYVFIMPDGSRLTVHCEPTSATELRDKLGAVAFGRPDEIEEIEATLYGRTLCALCVIDVVEVTTALFLDRIDRPANRLPGRAG